MSDSDTDQDFANFIHHRRRLENDDHDLQNRFVPKNKQVLITRIFGANAQETLDILINYDNEEAITNLKIDLRNVQSGRKIEGEVGMEQEIKAEIVSKIKDCLKYIHGKGINLQCPKQNRFRKAIILLFQNTLKDENQEVMKQVWPIMSTAKDFKTFKVYLDILAQTIETNKQVSQSLRRYMSHRKQKQSELYKQIEEEIKKLLLNPCQYRTLQTKKINIWDNSGELTLEQQIIIKLNLLNLIKSGPENNVTESKQSIEAQVNQFIKNYDCSMLIVDLSKFKMRFKLCDNVINQIMDSKFNSTTKNFQSEKIKPTSINQDNIFEIIKINPKRLIPKINQSSIIFQTDAIYSRFSIAMLRLMDKAKLLTFSAKYLSDLRVTLKKLIENQSLPIKAFGKIQESKVFIIAILRIFINMLQAIKRRQVTEYQAQLCYENDFINLIISKISEWSQHQQFRLTKTMQDCLGCVIQFAFLLCVFDLTTDKEIKPNLINFCIDLILKLDTIPKQWKIVKKTKAIIQVWTNLENQSYQKTQKIIILFLTSFFSSESRMNELSNLRYINSKVPNTHYCQIFSREVLKQVGLFCEQIKADPKFYLDQNVVLEKNIFIYKLRTLIEGRLELTTAMQISEHLYRIYEQYSHIIKQIVHFRTYINQYYQPQSIDFLVQNTRKLSKSLKQFQFIKQQSLSAQQCLERFLPNHIQNYQVEQKNFEGFVQQSFLFQNYLEMKNPKKLFPKEMYLELIQQIIYPLSIACQNLYNKILDKIVVSDQEAKKLNRILTKNHLSKEKSIYGNLSIIFFNLKMTVRLYLCNITKIITFEQSRHISSAIAPLFQNVLVENKRQKRNTIQLLNDMLAGESWKKSTRLSCEQIFDSPNSNTNLDRITLNRRQRIQLNILIPLLTALEPKLADYIACFSQLKADHTSDGFRFNHQIAFENQIKKCIPNRASFDYARDNTMTSHSKELFKLIFLPLIITKTQEAKKFKYGVYLKQINQLFMNQKCKKFAKEFISKILSIYRDKPIGQTLPQRLGVNSVEEPLDLLQYGIQPIQFNQFKSKLKNLLHKYFNLLAQEVYEETIDIEHLRNINQLFKQLNQQGAGLNQAQQTTQNWFIWNLVQKGYSKFKEHSKIKFETPQIQSSNNLEQEPIQLQEDQSNNSNDQWSHDVNRLVAEHRRGQRRRKKQAQKKKSPLYMFFSVMSLVSNQNQNLIKKIYQAGLNKDLLKYLEVASRRFQINEICEFINDTLPLFPKEGSENQKQSVIQYYICVLKSLSKIKNKEAQYIIKSLSIILSQNKNIKNSGFIDSLKKIRKYADQLIRQLITNNHQLPKKGFQKLFKILLTSDKQIYTEFKIKKYIYSCFEKDKKKIEKRQANQFHLTMNPNHIEINLEDYLKRFEQQIKQDDKQFARLTREIFEGWRSSNRLIYTAGLDSLFKTIEANESFVECQPSKEVMIIVEAILNKYVKQSEQQMNKKIQIKSKLSQVETREQKNKLVKIYGKQNSQLMANVKTLNSLLIQLLSEFPLLIPRVIEANIETTKNPNVSQFFTWLIEHCLTTLNKNKIDLLALLMCRNGLYIDFEKNKSCNQYISATVLEKCLKEIRCPENERKYPLMNLLYFTANCLGVKQFNDLSTTRGSPTLQEELQSIYLKPGSQSLISLQSPENHKFSHTLVQQCLYLICKNIQVTELLHENKMYLRSSYADNFIDFRVFKSDYFEANDIRKQKRVDKFQNIDDFSIFNKKNWWESLQDIIQEIKKETTANKTVNVQEIEQTMDQAQGSNPLNQIQKQIDFQVVGSCYKYIKDKEEFGRPRRLIGMQREDRQRNIINLSNTGIGGYFEELESFVEDAYDAMLKKDTDLSPPRNRRFIDQRYNSLRFLNRRMERRNQEDTLLRQYRQQDQLPINPLQFINILSAIKPNCEHLQKFSPYQKYQQKTKQEEIKKQKPSTKPQSGSDDQTKVQQQLPQIFRMKSKKISQVADKQIEVISEKEKQLRKNSSYKKLAQYTYFERVKFLLSAKEEFFESLPSEVMWEILQESRMLKRQKERQEREKRSSRRREISDDYAFQRRIRGRRGGQKKQQQSTLQIQKPQDKKQLMFSNAQVVKILKDIFFSVLNQRYGYNEAVENTLVSLLLQVNINNIKHKVLTTLIIILKNAQKIKMVYNWKDSNGNWKISHRPQGMPTSKVKNFLKKKILDCISFSLSNCLYDNKDLFTQLLSTKNFYDGVFQGENIEQLNVRFEAQLGGNEEFYNPLYELLNFTLQTGSRLSDWLIKYAKNLPNALIDKIFELMSKNELQPSFYDSLSPISNNERLKQLFNQKYSLQSPPPIDLLGKVLKYEFGKIQYAKKLHFSALKNIKESYNQFFVEVLSLYTDEQLKNQIENLMQYRNVYSKIINKLYEQKKKITESPVYRLLKLPHFLDYKAKESIFRNTEYFNRVDVTDLEDPFNHIIHVDPRNVFATSYRQLMSLTPQEIKRKIGVIYLFTEDGGGIGYFRIWTQDLFRHMLNASMFVPVSIQNGYQPSPQAKKQNINYLNVFKFLGRILAITILQNQVFPCAFPKTFHKMLLNIAPDFEDLKQVNEPVYNKINMLRKALGDPNYDIAQTQQTFTYEGKTMQGQIKKTQLKPGGDTIIVNRQNFDEYVSLITKNVLMDFCNEQYEKIKEGFEQIIPLSQLQIFTQNDLDLLISGIPEIDVSQFEKWTHCSRQRSVIKWFWEIVNESTKEERAQILQYMHGSARLPFGGFSATSFKINVDAPNDNRLPRVQSCFDSMTIPEYSSKDILKIKLFEAIAYEERK